MRILGLNWRDIRSPEAGGAELHLHEILRRLVAWGHEVTLVCGQFAERPGPAEEFVDGIRTVRVGSWRNAHITVPREAKKILGAERFDLLLDDVNKIPFFAPSWSPIPVLALFHHLLGHTVFLETNPLVACVLWLYERRVGTVYRETPSIAVSRSTATELTRRGIGADAVTVIEPGLDQGLYRPDVAPKADFPLLLVVSRLKTYKRVDVAIRALAAVRRRIPEARLVVIGSGERRRRLEDLARRLDQPVLFLGAVPDDEKVRWLNRAHLVLNPSEKEGWGLVGLEAMACGTPVVASDVQGHRDSIPEGRGLLCPPRDPEAMARQAFRLVADPEISAAMRSAGLRWARRFSWDDVAARVYEIMRRVAGTTAGVVPTATAEPAAFLAEEVA